MLQTDTTEEEVTTVENTPRQVLRKTTRQVEPQVKGEHPQKVYEKKKTIFRSSQVIWYIVGVIETLLLFRFVLKALGANPYVGFTTFIYNVTAPFTSPFNNIFGTAVSGNSSLEWSTIIAALVYLCLAWGLIYLLDLIYPITPQDVNID